MKMNVMGFKHSKGEFDGTKYDYVTIYTVARMKAADNQRGFAGIEIRGEPHLVEKLSKIEFSNTVPCEVETEMVATGKGQFQEMVVNVTPIKAGNNAAA